MNDKLSAPDSKAGRLQRACLELLREHERNGDIPTNGHFVFYELEQRGVIPKEYDGVKLKAGRSRPAPSARRLGRLDASTRLDPVELGRDETRSLSNWPYAPTVAAYVADSVERARIDLWAGEEPPLLLCEARTTMGVFRKHAYEYLTPITATNGQSGGFIVTDIAPKLRVKRRVLYIGDYELRGPADQIEANTRRYIEEHTNRVFSDRDWTKIALTAAQVKASPRLKRLTITKLDKRYKPAKEIRRSSARLSARAYVRRSGEHSIACCPSRRATLWSASRRSARKSVPRSPGSHGGARNEPRPLHLQTERLDARAAGHRRGWRRGAAGRDRHRRQDCRVHRQGASAGRGQGGQRMGQI